MESRERIKSWGSHCTLWLSGGFSGEEKLVDVAGPELLEASKHSNKQFNIFHEDKQTGYFHKKGYLWVFKGTV